VVRKRYHGLAVHRDLVYHLMSAGTYNLAIEQNATFSLIMTWVTQSYCAQPPVGFTPQPVDLTGYTVMLQIRPFQLSTTILFDASSDITLGGVAGTITLIIPATTTQGFTWWNGVYDLILTSSGGVVTRLLQGLVSVSPGVTP
jgi:hypothetical protein